MKRILISLFAVLGLATGFPSFAQLAGQQGMRTETVVRPSQYPSAPASHQRDITRSPPAQTIQLDAVSPARLAAEQAAPRPGVPHKIGFARDISDLASAAATASSLKWQPTPEGGLIAALSVNSPGALGIRLGLLIGKLPPDARLRSYSQGSTTDVETSGQTVLNSISRNRAAGDTSVDGGTWWAPAVDGPEATLEIELAPGVPASAVEFSIPRLSHFTESRLDAALAGPAPRDKTTAAGTCELDVSCYPAWSKESDATALMQFVSAGSAYMCTGTLLNSAPTTFIPYFLSANHCISDQTTASTLETIWFYHSTACNSGVVSPSYQALNNGATLLYATTSTDTSFLWLDDVPPVGAAFAGWSQGTPSLGVQVTSIEHPEGDPQKIAFGATQEFVTCTTPQAGSDTFTCSQATQFTGTHLDVNFSLGTVEPGSSGSGIFTTDSSTGAHYLVGQLHGGSASCTTPQGDSFYGRFDLAYNAALSKWLNAPAVSSLSAGVTGSGKIVSSPGDIDCGATCVASFPVGTTVTFTATPTLGSGFVGWGGACSGSSNVCTVVISASTSLSATFSAQAVTPASGYWWNPAEPGRGYVIEVQGATMFFASFLYASSGEATWASSDGPMTTPLQYSGSLINYSGGQTLTGAYQPAAQNPAALGTVSISFSSPTTATLTWPGGTIPIERFSFGPGGATATQPAANPQTGYWWNPAEPGRGYTIEVQDGVMYFAGYMYDTSGNPLWYLSTGNLVSSILYQGTWQQFANGETLTGTYQAPGVVNADVGSVTLQIASPTSATLTLPNARQIPLVRYIFGGATPPNIAGNWSGTWSWSGPTTSGCPVNDGGSFSMTIAQSGNYFSGTMVNATGINTVNTDCSLAGAVVAAGGTASGTLSGDNLTLSFLLPAGGTPLSFTGTAVFNNNTLTGSIVRSTGGSGTFTLTLQ